MGNKMFTDTDMEEVANRINIREMMNSFLKYSEIVAYLVSKKMLKNKNFVSIGTMLFNRNNNKEITSRDTLDSEYDETEIGNIDINLKIECKSKNGKKVSPVYIPLMGLFSALYLKKLDENLGKNDFQKEIDKEMLVLYKIVIDTIKFLIAGDKKKIEFTISRPLECSKKADGVIEKILQHLKIDDIANNIRNNIRNNTNIDSSFMDELDNLVKKA